MKKTMAKLAVVVAVAAGVVGTTVAPALGHDCASGSYETNDCFPDTTH